ncbi:hypothetical protein GIB67_022989 [Kingdonia uniflora]|uniref:Uncharacterized protein n=1 Tax=Kingdonia uniflora TaxID=39325 RepID=A0A7J7P2S0_9MAGN|nr:hypothetical protein GIB67_022989 [Kingdonia uniflora]
MTNPISLILALDTLTDYNFNALIKRPIGSSSKDDLVGLNVEVVPSRLMRSASQGATNFPGVPMARDWVDQLLVHLRVMDDIPEGCKELGSQHHSIHFWTEMPLFVFVFPSIFGQLIGRFKDVSSIPEGCFVDSSDLEGVMCDPHPLFGSSSSEDHVSHEDLTRPATRDSPLPDGARGRNCIMKDMYGRTVAFKIIQLSGVAPEGFYRVIVDEAIRDDVQLFMEGLYVTFLWVKLLYGIRVLPVSSKRHFIIS